MKRILLIAIFSLPSMILGMDYSISYSNLSLNHVELTHPKGFNCMVAFPLQEKLNLRVSYGRVINERHYTGDVFLVGYFVGWARNDLIRSKSLLQMGAIGFEAHLIDASWLNAHASLSYLYSKLSGVRENLDMVGIERTLYAAEKWGVQLGCELSLRMWTKAQVSLNLGVYRLFAPSNTRSFVRDDPLKLEIDAIDYRVGIRYSIKSPKRVKTNT